MSTTGTDGIVDLSGWDTVSALSYTDANAAIRAAKSSPQTFSQAAQDGSASVTGTFGDWQLRTGGGEQNIAMTIPITGGKAVVLGVEHDLTAATADVLVTARFIDGPRAGVRVLKVGTERQSPAPASVESVSPKQAQFMVQATLETLLEDWLVANLAQFAQVLATVDFNADLANGRLAWLKPSYVGYAVSEKAAGIATLDNSVLGVLCLIDGNTDGDLLAPKVSAFAIPPEHRAGFVISSEKFLRHMVMPAAPLIFSGIEGDDPQTHFLIDNDGMRLTNSTALTFRDLRLDDGKVVSPTVAARKFTMEVNETEFRITTEDMAYSPSSGITIHLHYQGNSKVSFNAGTGQLDLLLVDQTGGGTIHVSQAMRISQIVVGVVAAVVGLAGGVAGLAGGAASKAAAAAEAAAEAAEAAGDTAMAVSDVSSEAAESSEEAATVEARVCGVLVKSGSATEVANFGRMMKTIAKIGMIGGGLAGLAPSTMAIVEAVEGGEADAVAKVTDLTDYAVGALVRWPDAVPSFRLVSADLAGALRFGLDAA